MRSTWTDALGFDVCMSTFWRMNFWKRLLYDFGSVTLTFD